MAFVTPVAEHWLERETLFRAITHKGPHSLSLLSMHLKSIYVWLSVQIKQNFAPKKD